MNTDTRKRPWLAALLAIVYPGLGHVYLRSWHRALLWFLTVLLTAVLFIPASVFERAAGPSDVLAAAEQVPIEAALAITLVAAFSVIDAYLTAKRTNAVVGEEFCAHCGRVIDEDLSFCHWCTEERTSSES